jgi:hypothetical protein
MMIIAFSFATDTSTTFSTQINTDFLPADYADVADFYLYGLNC